MDGVKAHMAGLDPPVMADGVDEVLPLVVGHLDIPEQYQRWNN